MFNFLHTFTPESILISFGPFNIFYYGVFIVTGILLGSLLIFKLASYYDIDKNTVIDSAFWVVISAIAGGRLYHVFLELPFYIDNPLNIFMLWRGGLAIHGAIIAGLLAIFYFAKKNNINAFLLAAIYTPALALGQALGRWGNYFNQELYGLPSDASWAIPIEYSRRITEFRGFEYFHPTFLYESIGNIIICALLLALHKYFIKFKINRFALIIAVYLLLYSILRFFLEFIRIDKTPDMFGLRFPQIASIIIASIALYLIYRNKDIFTKKSIKIEENKEEIL